MNSFFNFRNNTHITVFTVVVIFLFAGNMAWAVNALLSGKIIDATNNKPANGVKYELVAKSNGKKLNGKTLKDGTFQQIVASGETYTINIADFNILRYSETFLVPYKEEYSEFSRDFSIQTIKSGQHLTAFLAFAPNSSEIKPEIKAEMSKYVEILLNNRSMDLVMTVGVDGTFQDDQPPKQVKAKKPAKVKKDKKGKPIPQPAPEPEKPAVPLKTAADKSNELLQQRIASMRAFFEQASPVALQRITFKEDSVVVAKSKTNLDVKIGTVKDRFN